MFQVKFPVSESLLDDIEAYFCEQDIIPWTLFQERVGCPYFILGYFEDKNDITVAWENFRFAIPKLPENFELTEIEDRDWQNAYKAYLKPWNSRDLHWVPSWMRTEYRLPENHKAIFLDAGMAFGTGTHETTQLCAERLLDYRDTEKSLIEKTIIDAGCGSGILAISAYLLGAENIFAFDIDPDAITVSKENLTENKLPQDAIHFYVAGIDDGLAGKEADFLMANILAPILMAHADVLLSTIKPQGELVLSGILTQEIKEVQAAFESVIAKKKQKWNIDTRSKGEWSDLRLKRL